MKYSTATHALLVASLASSLIGTGSAVPQPGPAARAAQLPKTRNDSQAALSRGLLVDREGNLYSPRTASAAAAGTSTHTPTLAQRVICVRGGALCVDNEGNLYTPKETSAVVVAPTIRRFEAPAPAAPASSNASSNASSDASSDASSSLRGGSNNHNIGGLGVDTEGNLFATQGRAALLLRGGDLSVDNEGNLYTPRRALLERAPRTSNRRSGPHDAVLLTKNNKLPNTATTTSVSSSSSSSSNGSRRRSKTPNASPGGEEAMAFIGYNNALMET